MKEIKTGKRCFACLLAVLFVVLCTGTICFAKDSETVVCAADTGRQQLRLGNVTVYEAKLNKSVITVPIYAQGGIDMRAYDVVFTYDTDMLELTDIAFMEESGYCRSRLEETLGTVHLAGVTSDASLKSVNRQVGTLTFLLKSAVRADDVHSGIGLTAYAFGPDTNAETVSVRGGVVVLNKSKAPDASDGAFAYGDVNKNGKVTATDALSVLRYVVDLPTNPVSEFDRDDLYALALADADADGVIGAADALRILRVVVELEDARSYNGALADPAEQRSDLPDMTSEPKTEPAKWNRPETLNIGDVDSDGVCGIGDALAALPLAADDTDANAPESAGGASPEMADVNGDGKVTMEDVQLLTDAAAGYYTNFGYVKPLEERVIYVDSKSYTRGDYCFRTLKEAIDLLNSDPPTSEEERITVRFAPGTYREWTTLKAPYVTYEAMDAETEQWPNITFYYGCGNYYASFADGIESADSSSASTTVAPAAHDFCARHIMFENSYNIYMTAEEYGDFTEDNNFTLDIKKTNIRVSKYQTQALALRVDADRCTFYDCRIIGRQDTLLMHNSNRVYFEECYIEGTVDFIYGSGTAVFERCTVNSPYHAGHITAAATPDAQPYGFLFHECSLTMVPTTESDAPKEESYSLGRPWNGSAMVTYCRCRMDKHISDKNTHDFDRFITMNENYPKEAARYAEYQTMDIDGNLIDLKSAAPDYEKILTDEDMEGFYAPARWLEARYNSRTKEMEYDGWNPGNYE